MDLPVNVSTGLVVGRYIADVIDGQDANLEPDALPVRGQIVFTASVPYLPNPTATPDPVTIMRVPIVGVLDSDGYLCTPYPGTKEPQYRGVRLIATDDPDISVEGWTWDVTYFFDAIDGHKLAIPAHGFALPSDATVDLTKVAKVPSSPGYSLPQAEAAVLRAEEAALTSAQDAAAALDAALRAEQAAAATDQGITDMLSDPGTQSGGLLVDLLDPKANTEDVNIALMGKADRQATESALADKADSTAVSNALALKADLSGGKVPVNQLPADALVTDANVSAQINGAQTGPAIDQRVNDVMTPVVEQITADYIASDPAVVDAAAAAVDANPKILDLEEAIPVEGQRAERDAIAASEKLAVDGAVTGTIRNLIPNAGPYAASPAWLSPNWGTGGAGTRAYAESPNAASGRGYMRNTWTTSATAPNYSFRTLPGACTPGKYYAGSISVWSSRKTVLGAVLYFYDSSGTQVSSGYNRLYEIPSGVVTKLDVNGFQAPAGAVSVRLSVNANPTRGAIPQAGDIIDLSGAVVVEGGQVPDFFDGDMRGSYWVTTDHTVSEAVAIAPAKLGEAARAPVAAGTRNGTFYRSKRLYMPQGADLSSLRRRIKAALDGKNSFRLAWLGHSIVAGQGGTPGTVDNVRLLQQRASQVGIASTGMVTAVNNTTVDSRITFDPEWESIGAPRTNMQLHRRCLVAGKQFTYKSDTAGTIVDIYTFGNGSAVAYSIDGGAPVTITPTGTSAVQVTTVTGLSNAKHTVVITSTTTTAAYLLGVSVRGSVGLEIGNFGYSGSIAYDWTPTYFTASARFYNGYNGVFTSWNADAAIIQLGANELIHGFTPAELESNLNAIIDAARVAGKDIVLVLDTPVEDATRTTWFSQYVPTVYSVADAQRVPLVDFTAHWINRSVAAAQSFYADQWHPNNTGYYNLHGVMADLLLP